MCKKLKNIAIIPARGGSKRIPRKNLRPLAGKPLLQYTIEAALQSEVFTDIYVSSDDSEILELATSCGVLADKRPPHLAIDTAKNGDVIYEFLSRDEHKSKWDVVTMCLPTCPLRNATHIKEAYEQFIQSDMKTSLIGVSEYEFPPLYALKIDENNNGTPVAWNAYGEVRTQDFEPLYHPNGSIYISTIEMYMQSKNFFYPKMLTYTMSAEDSVDIDYEYQFSLAEVIQEKKLI